MEMKNVKIGFGVLMIVYGLIKSFNQIKTNPNKGQSIMGKIRYIGISLIFVFSGITFLLFTLMGE